MHAYIGTTWKTHVFVEETNPSMSSRKELWEKKQQQHTFTASLTTTIFTPLNNISHEPQRFSDFSTVWPQQKQPHLKVATPGHKGIVTREGCHKETQDLFHNTWIEDLQSRGGCQVSPAAPCLRTSNLRSVVGCLEKVPKMLSFHGAFSWWFSFDGIESEKNHRLNKHLCLVNFSVVERFWIWKSSTPPPPTKKQQ